MALTPLEDELRLAVTTTTERGEGPPRWLTAGVAKELTYQVTMRGEGLSGLVHQAVRIYRLLERAGGPGGYVVPLHCEMTVLRPSSFKRVIEAALAAGRLNGVTESASSERIGDEVAGVRFLERGMDAASKPFDLAFLQMPAAAGMLDIVQNMLGPAKVAEICAPLLGTRCTASAEQVHRALLGEVNAWLVGRAGGGHAHRQARRITAWLDRNGVQGQAIDDEAVMRFWEEESADSDVDGFRRFRSAARKMLSYMDVSATKDEEARMSRAVSLSQEKEFGGVDLERVRVDQRDAGWTSPLLVLGEPPADRIKWFTDKGATIFEDFLQSTDEAEDKHCLFAGRPDARFLLTLLRYAEFGPQQDRIINAKGRGKNRIVLEEDDLYARYVAAVVVASEQTTTLLAATAWALLQAGRMEGVPLVREIDDVAFEDFAKGLREQLAEFAPDEEWSEEIGANKKVLRFRRNAADVVETLAAALVRRGEPLGARMSKALGSIERFGFNPQDRKDPAVIEGLAAGAEAVLELKRETARIASGVAEAAREKYQSDRSRFHDVFYRLYGAERDDDEGAGAEAPALS